MELDRAALDRHITGGRYSAFPILGVCSKCKAETPVLQETEYGASYWTPEQCAKCGKEWDEDNAWTEDEPPEASDDEIERSFDAYR